MATKRTERRHREKHPVDSETQIAATGAPAHAQRVALSWVPRWLQGWLLAAAAVYLSALMLNATAKRLPNAVLPPSLLFFTQTTCLFPTASRMAIDYRLEGWECDAKRFREIDVPRHFPMHPDDKENRFHRVGHFYRQDRTVMRALERYMIEQENIPEKNTAPKHTASQQTAASADRVGGIRVSSLRIPFPELGKPIQRWAKRPLEEYPATQVKHWYYTPVSRRAAFCAGKDPSDEPMPSTVERGGAAPDKPGLLKEPAVPSQPTLPGEQEVSP